MIIAISNWAWAKTFIKNSYSDLFNSVTTKVIIQLANVIAIIIIPIIYIFSINFDNYFIFIFFLKAIKIIQNLHFYLIIIIIAFSGGIPFISE